jgi:hypothetical protein
MNFTAFQANHPNGVIYLKVKRLDGGTVGDAGTATVAGNGTASITLASVLANGTSYHADFYVETNNQAGCQSADHQWRKFIDGGVADGGNGASVTQTYAHSGTDMVPIVPF